MNDFVDSFAYWLVDYYLATTVLLAAVLVGIRLCRQPVKRLALAKAAIVAMIAVAALCALPGWSLFSLGRPEAGMDAGLGEVAAMPRVVETQNVLPPTEAVPQSIVVHAPAVAAVRAPAASARIRIPWATLAVIIFLVGSAGMLLWLGAGALAARRLVARAQPASDELRTLFQRTKVGDAALAELMVCDEIDVAVALGVFRPRVLLPQKWVSTRTADELTTVLAHEAAHICGGDLKWLAACRSLSILQWAQPLYWLLRKSLRLDQEALADAAAADVSNRHRYAEQLVAWARELAAPRRLSLPAALGLWEGPSQLRRRVALLMDDRLMVLRRCSRAWVFGATVLVIALAVLLSMTTLEPLAVVEAGERVAAAAASTAGVRTLSTGTRVEILAIGTDSDTMSTERWWRPDGTPLVSVPFRTVSSTISNSEYEMARQAVILVPELPTGATVRTNIVDVAGIISRPIVKLDGQMNPRGYYGALIRFARRESQFRLRVDVAAGVWTTIGTAGPQGETSFGLADHKSGAYMTQAFSITVPNWGESTAVEISHTPFDQDDVRMIAVDKAGKQHTPDQTSNSTRSAGNGVVDFTQFDFRGLKSEDVDHFELQTRDFQSVQFNELPTQPDANRSAAEFHALAPEASLNEETVADDEPAKSETQHTVYGVGTTTTITTFVAGNPATPWDFKPNVMAIVVQDEAGKPLEGVEAIVYRVSPQSGERVLVMRSTTDAEGEVEFVDLVDAERAAEFQARAAKSQFPLVQGDIFYTVLKRSGLATLILPVSDFTLAGRGLKRSVRMRPAAELSGRVTDSDGKPVDGATVAAGSIAGFFVLEGVNAVKTDADGRYRFSDRVAFNREAANQRIAEQNRWALAADRDLSKMYPAVYDPADDTAVSDLYVTHPDFAVTTVRGGDVPGSTEVVMAPGAAIEGRLVEYGASNPVEGVRIRAVRKLSDVAANQSLHIVSTFSDAEGDYRLNNLPAGIYDVWAEDAGDAATKQVRVSRGLVAVEASAEKSPVRVPDMVLGPGATVRGRLIEGTTGKPLDSGDHEMTVNVVTQLIDPFQNQGSPLRQAAVDRDGRFSVQALPGRSRIFLMVNTQ